MQIERDEDRTIRTDRVPDGFEEVSVRVFVVLGHHGAVQGEQDRFWHPVRILAFRCRLFFTFRDVVQEHAERGIIDLMRHVSAGLRFESERSPDLIPVERVNDFFKSRDLERGALKTLPDGFVADLVDTFAKSVQVAFPGRKTVGFQFEISGKNSFHSGLLDLFADEPH